MNQEHLDAEVLAGWAEGSLDRRVRAAAEAHAADCPRCQALLAAMARTEPVEVPLRAGWLRPPLRWMVPLATAAAALLVWVMVSRELRPPPAPQVASRTESSSTTDRVAVAPPQPAPAASQEAAPAEPQGKRRNEARAATAPAAKATEPSPTEPAETVVTGERPARVDELVRDAAASGRPPLSPPAAPLPPRQAQDAQRQAQAAQPTQAQAPPVQQQGTPAAAQAQQQSAQAAPQVQERVAVTTATPDVAVERRRAIAAKALGAAAAREVVSPDPSVRWRFGAAGLIERSRDGGKTWLPATSGVSVDLRAGSAPSPTVCWIVGDSGTILLTTDGLTWRRVPFPVSAGVRSVAATDERTATVTTADGRMFTTADGGATWR